MRAADPRAGGITAMLVAEDAFEHEDLLAADVSMRVEARLRSPAHQGGVLGQALVQGGDLEPRDHALLPVQLVAAQRVGILFRLRRGALIEVDHAGLGRRERCGYAGRQADVGSRAKGFAVEAHVPAHDEYLEQLGTVMGHRLASLKQSKGDAAVGRDVALFQRTFPRLSLVQVGRVYDDAEGMVRMESHIEMEGWF
jgi:hypothetical protein